MSGAGLALVVAFLLPKVIVSYDLDGDSVSDSSLELVQDGRRLVLRAEGPSLAAREIPLADGTSLADGYETGRRVIPIGDHVGGPLSEVAVLHRLERGGHAVPALSIVDLDARAVIATVSSPQALDAREVYAYAAYPLGPQGRRYPFFGPSQGDGTDLHPFWGYACMFRPGASGNVSGACGTGFIQVLTKLPGKYWYREVGGYQRDENGDGWEDVTLIYHSALLTISGRTGKRIALTRFDVAKAAEPHSPPLFHAGRNYGVVRTFSTPAGLPGTMILSGGGVGTFADHFCGVSRFAAGLVGAPRKASRKLTWSRWYGFSSHTFSKVDPSYVGRAEQVIARRGNHLDGCIHRFGDGATVIDRAPVVIFNAFSGGPPVAECIEEQYALYLPPVFADDKYQRYIACEEQNEATPGTWTTTAYLLEDGRSAANLPGNYVWGQSSEIVPGGERVYLVEELPALTRFDLADVAVPRIRVMALSGGRWVERGVFPVQARPHIIYASAERYRGVGSMIPLQELSLEDRDGDGLLDVQLYGGGWVGYSTRGFELKS